MKENKESRIENILGWLMFASMFLPFLFLNKHHNCEYSDKCLRVWYDGHLGICIEKAIDDMCMTISVFWWFIIYGSALIISKGRTTFAPFIVVAIVIAFAFFLALVDPSKWKFVIALIPSIAILITAVILDNRKKK